MANDNKWIECRNALIGISAKTIEMGFDSDGIDLCFLNSNATFKFKDEVQGVQVSIGSYIPHLCPNKCLSYRIQERSRQHSTKSLLLVLSNHVVW